MRLKFWKKKPDPVLEGTVKWWTMVANSTVFVTPDHREWVVERMDHSLEPMLGKWPRVVGLRLRPVTYEDQPPLPGWYRRGIHTGPTRDIGEKNDG